MEHINETKKSELNVLRRKKRPGLMFQLWGMMMGLVVLTAACMWFVQVFFFEHTYAETALSNSLKQLQPVMSDLTNRDLTEDDRLLEPDDRRNDLSRRRCRGSDRYLQLWPSPCRCSE